MADDRRHAAPLIRNRLGSQSSISAGNSTTDASQVDKEGPVLYSPFGNAEVQRPSLDEEEDEEQPAEPRLQPKKQQLTLRAVLVGLCVGSMLCYSNMYFGLQTGWITMGSLQSAILGYGVFHVLHKYGCAMGLSVEENVIIQTTSVATATMPLAAGLVGVIPAMSILTPADNPPEGSIQLSYWQLVAWSMALAFFGAFLAVPLRLQTIIKEQLRFPSGTATANIIRTLHGAPLAEDVDSPGAHNSRQQQRAEEGNGDETAGDRQRLLHAPTLSSDVQVTNPQSHLEMVRAAGEDQLRPPVIRSAPSLNCSCMRSLSKGDTMDTVASCFPRMHSVIFLEGKPDSRHEKTEDSTEWQQAWSTLLWTFTAAAAYTLLSSQVPALKSFPVFSWFGLPAATAWGWELTPSMGYIGQGMIMGPKTAFSMLGGAIAGYAILGPMAQRKHWVTGAITDWEKGASGWILWVSLAIMLGDSLTSLSLLSYSSWQERRRQQRGDEGARSAEDPCPPEQRIPTSWWVAGLLASTVLCTAVLAPMFRMPVYEPAAAVALAMLVAVLAVRALGQTDLNPVSGVGKLSQLVFAVIAPGKVVSNLVAGAIAEAGANQAGDMMQDFKTAHLLGVCPRSQFFAMIIGSGASVFLSVSAYALYTTAYKVPSEQFPAPTAQIWLNMAKLVNGGKLPAHVVPFCVVAAALAALLPVAAYQLEKAQERQQLALQNLDRAASERKSVNWIAVMQTCLPSGIGFAVGMYVAPKFTIPRVIGSIAEQVWLHIQPQSHKGLMVVLASGLVLGEGTAAIADAVLKSFTA